MKKMYLIKKIISKLLRIILLLFAGAVMGTLLLMGCYMLPTARISNHVAESAATFQEEGTYPQIFDWCTSQLDNYTDALMLLNAVYSGGGYSVIDQAMSIYRIHYQDKSPAEELVAYYDSTYHEEEIVRGYGRYWHGYLIFLKPALLLLNYDQIRILNLVLQPFLVGILLYILHRKNMGQYMLPYIFSMIPLMPIVTAFSMQFSTVFYLFTLASISVVAKFEYLRKNSRDFYFFFIVGMLTSYFDLLTYPIATLGIPLILYMALEIENSMVSVKHGIGKTVCFSSAWGIGYIGMWGAKWILGSVLTSDNLIQSGKEAIIFRTSLVANGEKIPLVHLLFKNIVAYLNSPFVIYIVVYMVICGIIILQTRRMKIEDICKCFSFLLIGLMPYVWWICAGNHSWIHSWFTNRSMCVSVFAVLCLFRLGCNNIDGRRGLPDGKP